MGRLDKVKESLGKEEFRKTQVKQVEKELGLPQQSRLEPEMKALYKAIFKKLKTPAEPAGEEAEPLPVIPPTPVLGGV